MTIENTIDQRKKFKEELILDINKLAKNKKFYQVSGVSPSKIINCWHTLKISMGAENTQSKLNI